MTHQVKLCPKCQTASDLQAPGCPCGHVFRTKFPEPPVDQTRAVSVPAGPALKSPGKPADGQTRTMLPGAGARVGLAAPIPPVHPRPRWPKPLAAFGAALALVALGYGAFSWRVESVKDSEHAAMLASHPFIGVWNRTLAAGDDAWGFYTQNAGWHAFNSSNPEDRFYELFEWHVTADGRELLITGRHLPDAGRTIHDESVPWSISEDKNILNLEVSPSIYSSERVTMMFGRMAGDPPWIMLLRTAIGQEKARSDLYQEELRRPLTGDTLRDPIR